ncbi:cyclodehydratase [Mycobacterium manitobense]|uniref:Cyclodehydratase n=1 Tax=[Mycobacterium] manitobense TaxID=190147 RepID=A0A9X3BNS7_9MYCO|nr:cyclodehydratase [[Mycobacterium] manitobense]MCV7171375.1 cyclodehydratase [[Mycobacterium] manitobense]
MTRYALDPSMPVLLRPDGDVQIGWDPRRALLVRPPDGVTPTALTGLLRGMHAGITPDDLRTAAAEAGLRDAAALDDLLAALVDAGVVTVARTVSRSHRTRTAAIRIHGRGPLSDLLSSGLRCSGARVFQSRLSHAEVTPDSTDLVVLSDYLVTEPRVVQQLHAAAMPHLPVHIRDGAGMIGPLVIPGRTSCLGCADLHRSDRDSAWPAVAAQLRGTVGCADRATLLATAALALDQVDRVIRAVRESGDARRPADPPPTLDTTLEFDVRRHSIVARRWSRHPHCTC